MDKKIKVMMTLFIALLLLIAFPAMVNAHDEGQGNLPTVRGPGVWWAAQDPLFNAGSGKESAAWRAFYDSQMGTKPPKYKSVESFKKRVNQAGVDVTGPGNSLWENCKKSKYVFWYGSDHAWYDTNTKITYHQKSWYTQTDGSNNSSIPWKNMTKDSKKNLESYKKWSSNWNSGKIILICSFAYEKPTVKKLIFKANSGTFKYDGSTKIVSGLHKESDLGQLDPKHSYEAEATKKEIYPGQYDVVFTKLKIYDENKKDITQSGEYEIEIINGKLIILDDEPIDAPDIETTEEREWRCIDQEWDEASAYTRNTIDGYEAFGVSGAPTMRRMFRAKETRAGDFAYRNPVPQEYESYRDWLYWKKEFTRYDPDALITEELDLEQGGVSKILSKYGGVYNIEKELLEETYEVRHCQPQERFLTRERYSGRRLDIFDARDFIGGMIELEDRIGYLSGEITDVYIGREPIDDYIIIDGRHRVYTEEIYSWEVIMEEWSPWEDIGGRMIDRSRGPYRDYEEYIYQILSVNCNKGEFQNVVRRYEDLSYANGDAGGVLKTPQVRNNGSSSSPLGRTYPTNRNSFYTDGESCDVFTCTAMPLRDSEDDSRNNKNNKNSNNIGYYQSEYPVKDPRRGIEFEGLDAYKDHLVFFRDNEDNEVRADIWYPKEVNKRDLKSFPGQEASGTSGKLYRGTPEIELTTIMPWGGLPREDRFTSFPQVKTWNSPKNRFIMKSQWSSKEGQPYEMSLLWTYSGLGQNHVPAVVDGDDVKSMTSLYSYYFDIGCTFENNERGYHKGYIPKNPFVTPYIDRDKTLETTRGRIKAIFVRAASDAQSK